MEWNEFLKFIEFENKRLEAAFEHKTRGDIEKRIFARTIKLSEEVGELCNQVLKYSGLQRKEKLNDSREDELDDELADVLITLLLLARILDRDIAAAVEQKIKKIHKRYEQK